MGRGVQKADRKHSQNRQVGENGVGAAGKRCYDIHGQSCGRLGGSEIR